MLKYPNHDSFHKFLIELNRIYLESPELHNDYEKDNFKWLDCEQNENFVYAMARYNRSKGTVAVFNFSNHEVMGYNVILPKAKNTRLLLHTDWKEYGGHTRRQEETWELSETLDGSTMLSLNIQPFTGIMYRFDCN